MRGCTKFPVAHRAATRDRKIGVAVSSTRRPESVQDTAAGSRVMVALMVPGEVAKVLALGAFPGALSPSELHVTLADLGAVEDLTSDQVTAVREVASDVARRWPVLTGEVAGLGRFSDSHHENGLHALWLAVDVPFLEDLRVRLVARLAEAGLPVDRAHGFMPHITLAYLPAQQPTPDVVCEPLPLVFDALSVLVARESAHYAFA